MWLLRFIRWKSAAPVIIHPFPFLRMADICLWFLSHGQSKFALVSCCALKSQVAAFFSFIESSCDHLALPHTQQHWSVMLHCWKHLYYLRSSVWVESRAAAVPRLVTVLLYLFIVSGSKGVAWFSLVSDVGSMLQNNRWMNHFKAKIAFGSLKFTGIFFK